MDFWAQHKDFILRVLAGFGVFLVALIARGIVYGDELETEQGRNRKFAGQIKSKKVISRKRVADLNRAATQLNANVESLAQDIGFDATDERKLRRTLLTRTFRRLISLGVGDGQSPEDLARVVDENFDVNLNGTFGALRLRVRDDVLIEAGERNVALPEHGMGFAQLVSIDSGDLVKYLLQLELMTRVMTDALGMEITDRETGRKRIIRADAIEEVRIDSQDSTSPPLGSGVNPQFLREYEVRMVVRGTEETLIELINRLESGKPRVPVRAMRAELRPRGLIAIELRMLAVAVNTSVQFAATETEETGQ